MLFTYSFFERSRNLCIIAHDVIAESTRVTRYLMNMSFQRTSFPSVNVISPCRYLEVTVSSRRHLTRNKLHTEASIGIVSARRYVRTRRAHYSLDINFAICTRNLYVPMKIYRSRVIRARTITAYYQVWRTRSDEKDALLA